MVNEGYQYILLGKEHYNPMGVIRSLGENGIAPIAIIVRSSKPLT